MLTYLRASRVFDGLPFHKLGPAIWDKVLGVFRGHIDRAVFPDVQVPLVWVCTRLRCREAREGEAKSFSAVGAARPSGDTFIDAAALYFGIEHFQGSAAGVDLVVMGEVGEPFEDAKQALLPEASQDLHVAGAARRTERPECGTSSLPMRRTINARPMQPSRVRWRVSKPMPAALPNSNPPGVLAGDVRMGSRSASALPVETEMRVAIVAFLSGLALAAAAVQAAPAKAPAADLGAAPPIELVDNGCRHSWHRTRWRDHFGYWHWATAFRTAQRRLRWPAVQRQLSWPVVLPHRRMYPAPKSAGRPSSRSSTLE